MTALRIRFDAGGSLAFDAEMQLEEYQLTQSATVYIEAYGRNLYRRFSYGCISLLAPPIDRALPEFTDAATVQFRVKIVDESGKHGRLLAVADRIHAQQPEDTAQNRICLLHVEYEDLGDRIWKLDLDGDWPLLRVHKSIENIREIVRSDARFYALVYPSVTEQILTEIVIERGEDQIDPEDDTRWEALWLKFAASRVGPLHEAASEADRRDWVRRAVDEFCTYQRMRERFAAAGTGGTNA